MTIPLLNLLFLTLYAAIAAGGLQTAVFIARRLADGEEVIPAAPRREVPWGLLDFCIAFLALAAGTTIIGWSLWMAFAAELTLPRADLTAEEKLVCGVVSGGALGPMGNLALPNSVVQAMTVADSLLKLAVMLAVIPLISIRTGTTARDWGLDTSQMWDDIVLGARAFCVLIPIVMIIQATLVVVFQWPSRHPLIESLKESPSWSLFAASFVAAVIMAPIAEEWSFRVLLQGWLEKVASRKFKLEQLLVGGLTETDAPQESATEVTNPLEVAATVATAANGSHRLNGKFVEYEQLTTAEQCRPCWPIFASAAIFALVHFSHGPDFVPLFVLSLGLGYLYRQTHRIMPSLVVHFGLNLMTMVAIGGSLLAK